MRHCGRCKTSRPESDFYRNRADRSGLSGWCRPCSREYYNTKRAHRIVDGRCLHHNEPLVAGGSRCPRCEETYRVHNLRKNYGITPEQYDAMLASQGGVCLICRQPPRMRHNNGDPVRVRRLAVDHDHETGKVRGLLCSNCNQALGKAKDEPARLIAMAAYLDPEPEAIGAGC